MIIETKTEEESEQKQLETHLARVEKYQQEGYPIVYSSGVTVIYGYDLVTRDPIVINIPDGTPGIVPKNSLTGVPDYSNPVWLWSVPLKTPDQTYQFEAATDVEPAFTEGLHD